MTVEEERNLILQFFKVHVTLRTCFLNELFRGGISRASRGSSVNGLFLQVTQQG